MPKYIPRAQEFNIDGWARDEHGVEVLGFELPGGQVTSIDRATFEFFFAPVLSTTAEIGGSVG